MICPRCNNLLIHGLCKTCTTIKFATKRYSNQDVSPVNPKRLRPSVIHEAIQQLEDPIQEVNEDQHVEILPQRAIFQAFRP